VRAHLSTKDLRSYPHIFLQEMETTQPPSIGAPSALRSSGFTFLRIRVTKPQRRTSRKKQTSSPASKPVKPPPPPSVAPGPTPIVSEAPKKKGRPRVDEPLRAVVRSLVETGQLKDKSRKVEIEIVRATARAAHPTLFLTETQPSRDKIFAALRAEGLISPR
jgi:hypothetical protein